MMHMFRRLMPLLFVAFLHGQEKPARLTFEVVSIKPKQGGTGRGRDQTEVGGSGL